MNDIQDTPREAALRDLMPLIEGLELPYLMALQSALNLHIAERQVEALAEARDKIRRVAASLGMTVEQILGFSADDPEPPKYMNPETGKTWSGKGRMPEWAKPNPEKFRVQ